METGNGSISKKTTTMTSHEILKADVLDILFDNRNKMYGAYELRKHYNNRMGIALGLMLSVVLGFVFFLDVSRAKQPVTINPFEGNVVELITLPNEPVQPEEPVRQQAAAPLVRQKNFTDRIEIVSNHTEADMPSQDELIDAVISNHNVDGPPLTDQLQPPVANSIGNQAGNEPEKKQAVTFGGVSKAAEFPGGQSAWTAFLNKYLRTPDDLPAGEKRTVLVRFTVSAEGNISNFEIVQSGGNAFDNEVIRVLKKMPKWKPAFQNGLNVSVIFTQPVTFMAFEE